MIAVFDRRSPLGTNTQRGTSAARNALKFTLFVPATIVAYELNLSQASTTGNARVALFTHDAGTNLPGTIIADSTVLKAASTIATTSTLYQLDLATPLSLGAGVYWLIQDDNAEGASVNVRCGLYTGAGDGLRKLYAGTASTSYTWSWALWADDTYVPLGYERYYVDPSDTGSLELGTDAEPFKALNTALSTMCNKTFSLPIQIRCRTSGSTADTTRANESGLGQMVPSATNYLEIVAETGHRAGTSWDATKYHLYPAWTAQAGTALNITHGYVRVDGLQIGISSMTAAAELVYWSLGSTGGRLSNCLIKGPSATTYWSRGISLINGITMWNCIIQVNTNTSSACVQNHGNSSFYSCTFIGGGTQTVHVADGTCVAKNCYAGGGSGSAYVVTTGSLTQTTCAASDTTATDAALDNISVNTTNFTNVTTDSENWALPGTGSALYGVGTSGLTDDPPGATALGVDINGATRTTTWDIGADEYVASGTTYNDSLTFSLDATLSHGHALTVTESLAMAMDASLTPVGPLTAASVLALDADVSHTRADDHGRGRAGAVGGRHAGPHARADGHGSAEPRVGRGTERGDAARGVAGARVDSGRDAHAQRRVVVHLR